MFQITVFLVCTECCLQISGQDIGAGVFHESFLHCLKIVHAICHKLLLCKHVTKCLQSSEIPFYGLGFVMIVQTWEL
jgi:hypothetical protein